MDIKEFFIWLWTLNGVRVIATHTAINLAVAVAASLKSAEFKPAKLAEFLYRKLAPYVLVYGVVKVIGADAGLDWLAVAAFALIEATLAADLAENLEKLGIPLPDALAQMIRK